jgi:hypothetical protein
LSGRCGAKWIPHQVSICTMSMTPQALQELLDELERSKVSRKRAWENLQEIRWVLKDSAGMDPVLHRSSWLTGRCDGRELLSGGKQLLDGCQQDADGDPFGCIEDILQRRKCGARRRVRSCGSRPWGQVAPAGGERQTDFPSKLNDVFGCAIHHLHADVWARNSSVEGCRQRDQRASGLEIFADGVDSSRDRHVDIVKWESSRLRFFHKLKG